MKGHRIWERDGEEVKVPGKREDHREYDTGQSLVNIWATPKKVPNGLRYLLTVQTNLTNTRVDMVEPNCSKQVVVQDSPPQNFVGWENKFSSMDKSRPQGWPGKMTSGVLCRPLVV